MTHSDNFTFQVINESQAALQLQRDQKEAARQGFQDQADALATQIFLLDERLTDLLEGETVLEDNIP